MKRILLGCAVLALITLPALPAMSASPATPAKEGEDCRGFPAIKCDKGLFCEFPAGQCANRDFLGKCEKVPEKCTDEVDPVCDCNGKTHSNDCERRMAGAQLDYDGECKKKK